MSQVDTLLNSLTEDEIAAYTATPETEEHIVIDEDRFITVPESLKRLAVQFDHDIETVTFDCPRYWDNHDMSQMAIYINYMRSDGVLGSYVAQNVTVNGDEPDVMHFDWTISGNATAAKGKIVFLVCVRRTDENGDEQNHWNSERCEDCYISEGLEAAETVMELSPDILTQVLLLNRITLTRAGVYVGSGEMPEGYNVQVDPNGELEYIITMSDFEQALTDAKNSGEFDGPQGPQGESGVYVGPGQAPEGYNVQIDPEGGEDYLITQKDLEAALKAAKESGEFDGPQGPTGEKGDTGKGLTILDYYDTLEALAAAVTSPEAGDAYGVGTAAPYTIYVWSPTKGWVDNGTLGAAAINYETWSFTLSDGTTVEKKIGVSE